jgi:hypothetical protein
MTKLTCAWMVGFSLVAAFACSDDDGSDVVPNPPPGSAGTGGGGAGGSGGAADAGPGGGGSGGRAGSAGTAGSAGSGGSAGCTPVSNPDAGADAGTDAGALDAGADASSDASASAPSVVSFAADIHPIFEASCGPCHVTDGSAGHNVGGELATAYADAVGLGQTLIDRVDGGGMPPPYAEAPNNCGAEGGDQPGDPGCLSVEEVALIQTWINQCFPQ